MGEKKSNHRDIGTAFEQKAVLFLREKGYQILKTNFYSKHGEIDIVAKDGKYIVFVEVKYRSNAYKGASLEAVTKAKQRHIILAARYYLYQNRLGEETPARFDVIAFEGKEICHIQNAFDAY